MQCKPYCSNPLSLFFKRAGLRLGSWYHITLIFCFAMKQLRAERIGSCSGGWSLAGSPGGRDGSLLLCLLPPGLAPLPKGTGQCGRLGHLPPPPKHLLALSRQATTPRAVRDRPRPRTLSAYLHDAGRAVGCHPSIHGAPPCSE